jgi:hypothetical protein
MKSKMIPSIWPRPIGSSDCRVLRYRSRRPSHGRRGFRKTPLTQRHLPASKRYHKRCAMCPRPRRCPRLSWSAITMMLPFPLGTGRLDLGTASPDERCAGRGPREVSRPRSPSLRSALPSGNCPPPRATCLRPKLARIAALLWPMVRSLRSGRYANRGNAVRKRTRRRADQGRGPI